MKLLFLGLVLCLICASAAYWGDSVNPPDYSGSASVCGDGIRDITEICENETSCTNNRVCDPVTCTCQYSQPCSEGYQCLNLTDAQALKVCTWTQIICGGSPLPDTNLKYCHKCAYMACEFGECLLPQQAVDRNLKQTSRTEPCNMEGGNYYYCYAVPQQTYISCTSPSSCMKRLIEEDRRQKGCTILQTGLCDVDSFCYVCVPVEVEEEVPETFSDCPSGCECMSQQEALKIGLVACGGRIVPCKSDESGASRFCYSKPIQSYCGNGYCEYDEDRGSCCQDCGCSPGLSCIDGKCATPKPSCPEGSACMPKTDCINAGCRVMDAYQCRKTVSFPESSAAAALPEVTIPDTVCCSCSTKPSLTECEIKDGFCIPREKECPSGYRTEGTQQCAPRLNKCCLKQEQPPTCQSACSRSCCETSGTEAVVCPVFNTTCFRDCMQECAPSIPVACNYNGACEEGESWKYCCTDCSGCDSQQFVCERLTGECVPPQAGVTPEQVDKLTTALNRIADLLQNLINLLSGRK